MGFWDGKERINLNDVNNSVLNLESKIDKLKGPDETIKDSFENLNEKINLIGLMVQEIYDGKKKANPKTEDKNSVKVKNFLENESISLNDLKKAVKSMEESNAK